MALSQRKLFTLEAMNFILLVYRIAGMDELIPLLVERQLGNDTVYFSSAHTNVISCNTDYKVTYLVDDKKCVSNQELLNGNHSFYVY